MLQATFSTVAALFLLTNFQSWIQGNAKSTTGEGFYTDHSMHQFEDHIRTLKMRVAYLGLHYEQRIDLLDLNKILLENELLNLRKILDSMEITEGVCVRKYRHRVPKLATVNERFAKCLISPSEAYSELEKKPLKKLENLESYYTETLDHALTDCGIKFPFAKERHTNCLVKAIKEASETTQENTSEFESQMFKAVREVDRRVKDIFECYSNVLTEGLNSIDEVLLGVEKCIARDEICLSCIEGPSDQRCPTNITVTLNLAARQSNRIFNPFRGLKSTTCVRVKILSV